MATEYELKLKAVLDDSDVQKKLSQLKKQQASQESSGQPGQGALGNIGQAIQRLNTSIANLEHAIEKLAAAEGKPQQAAGVAQPALAVPAAFGRGGRQAESTYKGTPLSNARSGYISTRAMAGDIARGFSIWDPNIKTLRNIQHQFRNFSRHGWTAKQLGSALMPYNDYAPAEAFLEKEGKWVGWDKGGYDMSAMQKRLNVMRKNYIKTNPLLSREAQVPPAKLNPRLQAQMRLGSALAFTALAGGIENYAEATGQTGLKKGANLVSNIGMGAATGALVGGPVGALIGGGIGALNTAFEELADRARDAAEALEGQKGRVRSGRRFDIDMKDFEQQRKDKEMQKKQATGTAAEKSEAMAYFRTQLGDTKKKYESVKSKMDESGIAAEGGLEAYEKKTLKLMELRGKDDAEVKARQDAADVYKDQSYWLKKHSARIEQLEGIVPKARELATSRFGLVGGKGTLSELILSKTKDLTRYGAMGGARGAAAAQQAELFKEALENLKAPDMTPVNSLASQGFMIGNGLGEEALLDETNKYLNEIAHLTREIKNKEAEAATYG